MKTIIARFEDMKKDPMAILEDGVSANTSHTNEIVIERLFEKINSFKSTKFVRSWLSIEYVWAYIKPRIKRRSPQTIEELKNLL